MTTTRQHTVKLPMPSQVVAGRYRIIERAGTGGMGLVFLGEELGTGRRVALKFLDPEPSEDESRLARFLREGKVGFEVKHPGAAELLDFGRDEAMRLFLCFEFVEGEDLRELLRREGRLRFEEARDITRQVGEVLAFAHGRDVVHRDIKPENIRVRRDETGTHVKVLDFGIARLLKDSGARLTAEGMLAGTPRYMAPEQVNDDPLSGAVDQYALGLVFYEMLTGACAMPGRNITQILMHQLQTTVPPLSAVDPVLECPPIDDFLARACAKAREARFATMHEFLAALRALPVDGARWPAPAPPRSEVASSDVPTRDQRQGPPPEKPLSDTFVRPSEFTEPETPRALVNRTEDGRREIPTEPERRAVARRQAVVGEPSPEVAAGAPAGVTLAEPALERTAVPLGAAPADSAPPRETRAEPARAVAASPVTDPGLGPAYPGDDVSQRSRMAAPEQERAPSVPMALEAPTDPERPAVVRRAPRAAGTDSVFGLGLPPAKKPSRVPVAALVLLAAAAVGFALVWWLTHRA